MLSALFSRPTRWLRLSLLLVVFIALGACSTVPDRAKTPLKAGPLLLERTEGPYTLAILDEIQFHVGNETIRTIISQEGTIDLHGQPVKVVGLSKDQLPRIIKSHYPAARGIEVTEFRPSRISILGEVFHQLHTQLDEGPMRVMDGIAAANGFTPLANKKRVTLLRQNAGNVEVYELDLREMMHGINLSQNILLKPGDIITVPRNFL